LELSFAQNGHPALSDRGGLNSGQRCSAGRALPFDGGRPLGVFLSGGIDSSASPRDERHGAGAIKTFSVGFANAKRTSLEYAQWSRAPSTRIITK